MPSSSSFVAPTIVAFGTWMIAVDSRAHNGVGAHSGPRWCSSLSLQSSPAARESLDRCTRHLPLAGVPSTPRGGTLGPRLRLSTELCLRRTHSGQVVPPACHVQLPLVVRDMSPGIRRLSVSPEEHQLRDGRGHLRSLIPIVAGFSLSLSATVTSIDPTVPGMSAKGLFRLSPQRHSGPPSRGPI